MASLKNLYLLSIKRNMNPLELKSFLRNVKLLVCYKICRDSFSTRPGSDYIINDDLKISHFQSYLLELQHSLKHWILQADDDQRKQVLAEYKEIINKFILVGFKGKQYSFYNRIQLYLDDRIFIDELLSLYPMDDNLLEQKVYYKIKKKKLEDIKDDEEFKTIIFISTYIEEVISEIISFLYMILETDSFDVGRPLDKLEKKEKILPRTQQFLVLHYLSKLDKDITLHNTKLATLISKVLGRNETDIRSYLTNVNNSLDLQQKDPKSPKKQSDLEAVNKIFEELSIPQLIELVQADLNKIP